jgi:hypothetical protein
VSFDRIQNLLRVPEQCKLLLTNLDGATTKLYRLNQSRTPILIKLRRTYLRNQNLITTSNAHGNLISISVSGARTNGQNGGLVDLLDGTLGKEDAAGGLGFGLEALDEDAVQKGDEVLDVAEGLVK